MLRYKDGDRVDVGDIVNVMIIRRKKAFPLKAHVDKIDAAANSVRVYWDKHPEKTPEWFDMRYVEFLDHPEDPELGS